MTIQTPLKGHRIPREAERTARLKVVYRSTGPLMSDHAEARLVIEG